MAWSGLHAARSPDVVRAEQVREGGKICVCASICTWQIRIVGVCKYSVKRKKSCVKCFSLQRDDSVPLSYASFLSGESFKAIYGR